MILHGTSSVLMAIRMLICAQQGLASANTATAAATATTAKTTTTTTTTTVLLPLPTLLSYHYASSSEL